MVWFILARLFTTVLDSVRIGRLNPDEKDLEILVLRQQLAILHRTLDKAVRPTRVEKLILAVRTTKLKAVAQRPTDYLRQVIRLFQPQTALKWHRELVRRKWAY